MFACCGGGEWVALDSFFVAHVIAALLKAHTVFSFPAPPPVHVDAYMSVTHIKRRRLKWHKQKAERLQM